MVTGCPHRATWSVCGGGGWQAGGRQTGTVEIWEGDVRYKGRFKQVQARMRRNATAPGRARGGTWAGVIRRCVG